MELKGSIAVVTGSSTGIGYHTARLLLEKGAEVYGLSRRATAVRHDRFHWLQCDVTIAEEIDRAFDAVLDRHGCVDILVNNAGFGLFGDLETLQPDEWHRLLATNLTAVFLCTRRVIPSMKARKRGMILNIGSVAGKRGFKGGAAYSATKFAINGLSESLMDDLREFGIRVSCVNPGSVETEFFDRAGMQPKKAMDPAHLAGFLVSIIELPDSMLPDQITVRPL
jgi:NAD(P)-dependent dehydrogenase (short-subunit alcohol dehydrogenase family)